MYLISVTPEDYLLAEHFCAIDTTKNEKDAKKFKKGDAIHMLRTLKCLGYNALLIKDASIST